jgi:predicted SprT family Zn-dependent metalloprotease
MSIAKEAFNGIYPGIIPKHDLKIKYSGKFNSYNANVYYNSSFMEFRLSKQWREVGKDIKIGLLQTLILKAFSDKKKTMNIDLYNIFLKKVHISVPKNNIDPDLKVSFDRVNKKYFDELMEMPNLVFGRETKRKLGSYEYGSDTLRISSVLSDHEDLIDYVMYHELLHKKFKYYVKNGRSFHHTREFREAEQKFENFQLMEKKITHVLKSKRKWYDFF